MSSYDMRISDWSSDVCSSDLFALALLSRALGLRAAARPALRDDAGRGGAAVRDAWPRRRARPALVAVGARRGAAAHGLQARHRAPRQRGAALAVIERAS